MTSSATTAARPVRAEPSPKRVRVYLGGEVVADTLRPLLVWESRGYPVYYIPAADVDDSLLIPDQDTDRSELLGDAEKLTVKAGSALAPGAARHYVASPVDALRDHIRFDWNAMDAWFEEDEEIFVHPRDPHARIDVLPSSRHVRFELDGITIAESRSPRLLFETGLPTRHYVSKLDVRTDLLVPSDKVTQCPYKGIAQYWSVRTGDRLHEDVAWTYRTTPPESQKIAGLLAFWKTDTYVDGVLQKSF
ncbi:DUF427 domain-containing protein [Amycolatopsis sp. SID8362]|uniref:DUF427 domain-containing protein n=1 Tax=Amycolatopsis sp. SID8362 TaxID=2690346 RepID=UPI001369861E|nr:DUF427 domain-containing protein [Amycolatopsis sp. SID8362]NBH03181.1 DUF427 domain-containing protein [Amycolatopsis sp. SID8362]NED39882.1 DUF427 domain-containing protein [Amycolatopsis sp. SID8362]